MKKPAWRRAWGLTSRSEIGRFFDPHPLEDVRSDFLLVVVHGADQPDSRSGSPPVGARREPAVGIWTHVPHPSDVGHRRTHIQRRRRIDHPRRGRVHRGLLHGCGLHSDRSVVRAVHTGARHRNRHGSNHATGGEGRERKNRENLQNLHGNLLAMPEMDQGALK